MVSLNIPKRGAKIYIPIIVPENWQVTVSIICSIIAFILMIIAMTTSSWEIWEIIFQLPRNDIKVPVWLNTTLHWGLRSVNLEMCENESIKYHSVLSLMGLDPKALEKSTNICSYNSFRFSSCSEESLWCISAHDTTITTILLISATVGLVISTLVALTKRLFQPIGYSICAVSCCVSILYYRLTVMSFRPSNLLYRWITEGEVVRYTGYSFYVLILASLVLITGMIMASWGTWRVFKEARVSATGHNVPRGEEADDPPYIDDGQEEEDNYSVN